MSSMSTSAWIDSVPPQSKTTASISASSGMAVFAPVVEPALEAGGVGVHAVERLELLPLLARVDAVEVGGEGGVERGGDVAGPSSPRRSATSAHRRSVSAASSRTRRRVGHEAVVRQGDAGRRPRRELLERGERLVEVEVGRRRRRAQHAGVGQADADGVADEEDPRVSESCRARWCLA